MDIAEKMIQRLAQQLIGEMTMDMRTKETVEKLKNFTTPELCDGGAHRIMDYKIKPLAACGKIVGPACTVSVPVNVSGLVPDVFSVVKEGEVIVIAGHGSCAGSYWGDYRSLCAKKLGVEGIVVDGAFRDYAECEAIGVPVFAKGVIPKSAGKERIGDLQIRVFCGGVEVNPGDFIVGDENGVLVIAPEEAEGIMERALTKRRAEAACLKQMEETGEIIPRVKL